MRTALADAVVKNRIMIAHDDHRHAVEDHGGESLEAYDARTALLNAIGQGFQAGLTVADVHRITGMHELAETNKAVAAAIEETQIHEGTVITEIKPKRTTRRTRKAIETDPTDMDE